MKKRLLALVLSLGMLCAYPAVAAEREMQPLPVWSHDSLSDIAALGLWKDEYYYCSLDPVTGEQLDSITAAVADKLALLEAPAREPDAQEAGLVTDLTKGGVINRLYLELAGYQFDFMGGGVSVLTQLGVVRGDGTGNEDYARPCTLVEALVMARRLILAAYDACGAGAKGLLWTAVKGETTLHLLGTVHVDRGSVYPFHQSLRAAIESARDVIFEVDFGDAEGMAAFAAMQVYADGTTLKDHVSPELYTRAVAVGAELGMSEEETAAYKPWVLANTFQVMALNEARDGEASMPMDSYIWSKALNAGQTVAQVESFEAQGELFDSLTPAYQETYLADCIDAYYSDDTAVTEGFEVLLNAWENRDPEGVDAAIGGKNHVATSGDELQVKLYEGRDAAMTAYADAYLKDGADKTGIMVVGAGHMLGDTGIVQSLKDLGYTVELAR